LKFATGGELHDLSKKKADNPTAHVSRPVLSFVRPEKMHFGLTYDTKTDDNIHALQPFVGV
jgi:hypothetical protein